MKTSETTPVFFVKKDNFVLWQFKNDKEVPIQCQPNSKGNAPKTIKGAKCSFKYYIKKNNPKLKYSFANISVLDGIIVYQEKLL